MSKISNQIREYVNDPDVAVHYGAWGILPKQQRRLIRKLCDTCDSFEIAADKFGMENIILRKEISKMKFKIKPVNAIVLNGKVTELTEDQVKSIVEGLSIPVNKGNKKLSDIKVGDTFKICEREFIVLEQSGDTTAVLSKDLIGKEVMFGDTPAFENSNIKKILDKFAEDIIKEVGANALGLHTVDQTTLDGMKYYGSSKALASLMTIDHVRKYADVLDKHMVNEWYWLVTPWSTPDRGYKTSMCVVAPSGDVIYDFSYYFRCGVRPFCIFSSSIFVSRET